MHRAEQILQAAAAAIEASTDLAAKVYQHHTLPLSAADQELPAVCVNQGEDEPLDDGGYSNLAYLDSLSTLRIALYAQGRSQGEAYTDLIRIRSVVHRALLAAPRTLGLAFVEAIRYGGASEPEYSEEGSPLAARMECMFAVQYRMSLTDPE